MAESKELTKGPSKAELERAYDAILNGTPLPQGGDPEVVSRAIVERILAAETFEDAFKPQELAAWREYLDVPVEVRSFHLNPTTYEVEGGSSVYAVVDLARLDDGEHMTVTCGGRNVLAQLVKMLEAGWMDRPVKLVGRQTAEGYQALWLEAA